MLGTSRGICGLFLWWILGAALQLSVTAQTGGDAKPQVVEKLGPPETMTLPATGIPTSGDFPNRHGRPRLQGKKEDEDDKRQRVERWTEMLREAANRCIAMNCETWLNNIVSTTQSLIAERVASGSISGMEFAQQMQQPYSPQLARNGKLLALRTRRDGEAGGVDGILGVFRDRFGTRLSLSNGEELGIEQRLSLPSAGDAVLQLPPNFAMASASLGSEMKASDFNDEMEMKASSLIQGDMDARFGECFGPDCSTVEFDALEQTASAISSDSPFTGIRGGAASPSLDRYFPAEGRAFHSPPPQGNYLGQRLWSILSYRGTARTGPSKTSMTMETAQSLNTDGLRVVESQEGVLSSPSSASSFSPSSMIGKINWGSVIDLVRALAGPISRIVVQKKRPPAGSATDAAIATPLVM